MAPQKLIWEAQSNDIWKLASELQKKSSEIDIYLQASKSSDMILNFLDNEVLPNQSMEFNYLNKNITEVTCFSAHKLMLSAASPFFKKLLHDHYNDYKDTCVTVSLPNVPAYCIRYILDFIYCGSVNINPDVFENVLEIAKILEVNCLVHYLNPSFHLEKISIPIQKGKKRKAIRNKVLQNVKKNKNSQHANLYKEDKSVVQLKRSSRIIKSRYSSDIYEVDLPKRRKTKVKKAGETGYVTLNPINFKHSKFLQNDIGENIEFNENQSFEKDENQHNFASNQDTIKYLDIPACTSIPQEKDTDIIEENNSHMVISPSSFSINQSTSKFSTITEHVINKDYISTAIKNKKFSNDSDVVVNAFVEPININTKHNDSNLKDKRYEGNDIEKDDALHNMLTVKKGNNEFRETSDSIDVIKAFDTPGFDCIHPNNMNILKDGQSDLSKQNRSSVDVNDCFSLDQLDISLKPSEAAQKASRIDVSFNEIDNLKKDDGYEIEDDEDGLFKLQVLLKECEDFTDSEAIPTSVNDGISPKSNVSQPIKFTEVESNIDFNQWISKEIHNYMIPKIDNAETHLSGLDGSKSKNDNLVSDSLKSSEQEQEEKQIQENDKDDLELSETKEDEEMEERTEYQCQECNKVFDNLLSIKAHIRGVHDEATNKCKFCGKLFKRSCDLLYHEKRHNDATLPCKMCDKSFKLKKDLDAHMTIHVGGKKFTCVHCNKELSSQRNLKNHISSVHFKHRSFICNICNKTYTKASTLQVHIRSVHTGERPYECEICNKKFADSSLLKIHKYTHTDERKYACKICGNRFNQYSNLLNHMRVHSNDKPFICLICNNKFKSRESLLKHKWMHTGLKPLKCQHCSKEFRIKESFERHMRKIHGENVQLPEIYFEIPKTSTSENSQDEVIGSIKDSEVTEEANSYLFETKFIQEAPEKVSQNFNSNSVIEIVNQIDKDSVTKLEYLSNSGSEIQLSYPVLSSHMTSDDRSNAMNLLSNSMSENNDSESIDMETLINSNDNTNIERLNPSNCSVLAEKYIDTDLTIKNQFLVEDVLKAQLESTVTQMSEKLVVLEETSSISEAEMSRVHEVTNLASVGELPGEELPGGELSGGDLPGGELAGLDDSDPSSFKIWLSQSNGSLSNVVVDVPEERNHNILIVSDPRVFSNDDRESLSLLNSQIIEQELIDTIDMSQV